MDFSGVDTEGLGNLALALMDLVFQLDIRTINTEIVPQLLTTFYPIWNPIWELVNKWLGDTFGFNTSPLI